MKWSFHVEAVLLLLLVVSATGADRIPRDGEDDYVEDDDCDEEEEEEELEEAEAVRMLSELPLSRLLALERQVRRAATTLHSTPAAPSAGNNHSLLWEGESAFVGETEEGDSRPPSALPLFGPRPPRPPLPPLLQPSQGHGNVRRGDRGGPPPWEEEEEEVMMVEVEEEPSWMPPAMKKSKSKAISKIFQGSVTALAFLAFGGYLLCLIIHAIKNKQQMQMMAMVPAATNANPQNLVGPVFVSGRRRRRRSVASSTSDPPSEHSLPEDFTRTLLLLADGYALYSGVYSPSHPVGFDHFP